MKLDWQVKPSKMAVITIVLLSMTPVLVSISIQQPSQFTGLVMLLSALLLFLMSRGINLTSRYPIKKLRWKDGCWTFTHKEKTIIGAQSRYSFSLGMLLFLTIENEDGQKVALWLFPDNLISNNAAPETPSLESRQIAWHQLNCCFHLSN